MSALPAARMAFVSLLEAQFAADRKVKVSGTPMGEDTPTDAIYLERYRSRFRFRGLGATSNNRREELVLFVVVSVYRTRGRQRVASELALERCESLLEGVEAAVVNDGFKVGGSVSWAEISAWDIDLEPQGQGWVASARATLSATHMRA